jgi:succinyl-diaminopimelate desuccinylase
VTAVEPELLERRDELSTASLRELLRGLVRVPSVNPGVGEAALAAHVVELLERSTAAQVHVVETFPGRPSVAAVLGSGSGPTLVLNGHLDTVPVDDESRWSVDPFAGEVRDGWLYGRGACDMKGGLAVQIAVARALSVERRLRGRLVLHFAVGEECAEPGTASLLRAGFGGDVGITGEATELQVGIATRGLAHIRVRLSGRSGHASLPQLCTNPLAALSAVLAEIERHDGELAELSHPLLPPPSCTPTMVRAGVKENSVPDECTLVLDRRLLPGERVGEAVALLESRLRAALPQEVGIEVTPMTRGFEPSEIDRSSPFAARLAAAVGAVGGPPCALVGLPFASDVSELILGAGIEAVTFGPGSLAEAHCADERVSLEQVRRAALAVTFLAAELLV